MEKADEIKPDYQIPADEMLLESQTRLDLFKEDEALFIEKVPDLKPPFAADWQDAINLGKQAIKDDDFLDVQQEMTDAVETYMTEGRNGLQTLYFYVERAFPGNKVVDGFFGHDRYEKARKSPLLMFDLLVKSYKAANDPKYHGKLIDKGLKPENIEALNATSGTLYQKYQERDKYISDRIYVTQERIRLFNKVWAFSVSVSEASKIVFQDNYAKLQQYLLYDSKKTENEEKPVTDTPEQN